MLTWVEGHLVARLESFITDTKSHIPHCMLPSMRLCVYRYGYGVELTSSVGIGTLFGGMLAGLRTGF